MRSMICNEALTANAIVTAGEQHRQPTEAHLHELLVAALAILDGPIVGGIEDIPHVIAVGQGVHQRRVLLVAHVRQIRQEALVDGVVRVQVAEGVEVRARIGRQGLQRREDTTSTIDAHQLSPTKEKRALTMMYSTSSCASPPGSVWSLTRSPYTFSTGMVALGRPDSDKNFIRSLLL